MIWNNVFNRKRNKSNTFAPTIYTITVQKYQKQNWKKAPYIYKLFVDSMSAKVNEHHMGVLKNEKGGMQWSINGI